MTTLIELDGLKKRFNNLLAVDGISLTVKKGEILGFLGPNGSGKSTTMRMITGYLSPDAGTVKICGIDVINNPVAAQRYIGYLPEGSPTYGDMTVATYLSFIADARQLSTKAAHQAIAYSAECMNISHIMHQKIDTLSKGYKRRVGLSQAILHNPDVLILDEPTDGLDPNQKHDVHNLIRRLSQEKAIIISTHILEEVETICSRAVIITQGRIVTDDTMEQFQKKGNSFNEIFRGLTNENVINKDKQNNLNTIVSQITPQPTNATTSFIHNTMAVFKREFFAYFSTPIAYAIMAIFVVLSGSLTFFLGGFFIQGQASLEVFFQFHPWLFLFLIPAIAMRLWAEERNNGSIELLLTLPMSTYSIVLGKFIAAWTIIGLCLLFTITMWLTVNYLGTPDNSVIAVGYIGSFFIAGGYLAISACISALSKNQVIAFIVSALVCFIFLSNGLTIVQEFFNDWAPSFILLTIKNLSFLEHFQTIVRGVVDLQDIVFFLSTILFFLFVNVLAVEHIKAK